MLPGRGPPLEVSYWEEGPEVLQEGEKQLASGVRVLAGGVGSRGRREGAGRGPAGGGGQARGSVRESGGPELRAQPMGGGGWAARGPDWLARAS